MKTDFRLNFEQLDRKVLLSSNPWYIDTIKAPEVWSAVSSSNTKPVVAIVDSGVDLTHPSLVSNLFRNPLDPVDGRDNDGNGYVDDITGWDFAQNDNSAQDEFWHGTHVAGIVNAIGNNNISILPLKFIGASGSGYLGAASTAINYAVDLKLKGINIVAINCSFGGSLSNNTGLSAAIKRASDNGIVVTIASGNNGSDLDTTPRYPGSLSFSNTITVAGTNKDNTLAGYSNYGVNTVSIAAPGTGIYSTLSNATYGNVSGTSMAAPMVSGAVGLLRSFGGYSASVIVEALKRGSSFVDGLSNKVSNGLLNISASFGLLKTMPILPPVVTIAPHVVKPPVIIVPKLLYMIKVENRVIKGWTNVDIKTTKPVVQIYVNNVLRYSVVADLYRGDTKKHNGFYVVVDRKFLGLKPNLVTVKIVDSVNKLNQIVYKGYMKKY